MPRALSTLETMVREISQQIFSGQLSAGQRLPSESAMQEQWGISRSVVREAMKVLATQGLVRIEQGRGMFVSETDITPLRTQIEWALRRGAIQSTQDAKNSCNFDISEGLSPLDNGSFSPVSLDQWNYVVDVRSVLEIAVAERAAQQADPHDIEALQAAIAQMETAPDDVANYAEADLGFHRALAAATKNPLWPAFLNSMNDLLRRYFAVGYHGHDNALLTARQHRAVLDAIIKGDAEQAAQAMREHMKTSRRDLHEARRKNRIPAQKS